MTKLWAKTKSKDNITQVRLKGRIDNPKKKGEKMSKMKVGLAAAMVFLLGLGLQSAIADTVKFKEGYS